jgi:transposase-like protein/integrase
MHKRKDEKDIPIVPDLAHVFPLPARVKPEPWEDLASLLSRTAVEMGYKQVNWLLRPEDCFYRRLDPAVCFLREDVAYHYLGHLLQLNEEALYKLTCHRFLLQMQAPDEVQPSPSGYLQRPLFLPRGHVTRTLFLSQLAVRVCPKCLAEEPPCGVLFWNIGPVVACLKHRIFLVDCCPYCQGKIPLLRSVLTHCPRCSSGDYRLAPTVDLPEEPLFLSNQALILAHLGVEEEYRGDMPTEYGESPLYGLLPWQYFQLLKAFRHVLDPFFPNHPLLQTVAGPPLPSERRASVNFKSSLGEWATFGLTFHALFTSWPDNFIALLESLLSVQSRFSGKNLLSRHFGELYRKYLYNRLKDPAFAFLREAFEDYLKKRYRGGRVSNRLLPFRGMDSTEVATQGSYVTRRQARQLLGVQEQNLSALVSNGTLRTLREPIGTKGKVNLWIIEKANVEALLEEWKNLLSLDAVAQLYLGVSKQQVLALTRADLLLPARGPKVDRSHTWYYKREEMERLETELLRYADNAVSSTSECVPLSNIASSIGLSLVESLKEILGGHLGLIDTEREIPLFQRLVLSDSEAKRFLKERLRAARSELNLLSAHDVMKIFSVGETTLGEWVRQGLLIGKRQTVNGKRRGLLFQKEMVDALRHTYVFAKEAAELLDVNRSTIYLYVSRRILHPLGPPRPQLFLREEVAALIMKEPERKEQVSRPPCPNPTCPGAHVVRHRSHRGRQRYHCLSCKVYFGETKGTSIYGLQTPATEVAQALLIVMQRGSLREAGRITGYSYQTISVWLKRAASQPHALTQVLASDLHLSQVEIDEFWSFVQNKRRSLPA